MTAGGIGLGGFPGLPGANHRDAQGAKAPEIFGGSFRGPCPSVVRVKGARSHTEHPRGARLRFRRTIKAVQSSLRDSAFSFCEAYCSRHSAALRAGLRTIAPPALCRAEDRGATFKSFPRTARTGLTAKAPRAQRTVDKKRPNTTELASRSATKAASTRPGRARERPNRRRLGDRRADGGATRPIPDDRCGGAWKIGKSTRAI